MVACWGDVLKKEGPVVGGVGDRGELARLDEPARPAVRRLAIMTAPPCRQTETQPDAIFRRPSTRKIAATRHKPVEVPLTRNSRMSIYPALFYPFLKIQLKNRA